MEKKTNGQISIRNNDHVQVWQMIAAELFLFRFR
jgi:hypothetical protein